MGYQTCQLYNISTDSISVIYVLRNGLKLISIWQSSASDISARCQKRGLESRLYLSPDFIAQLRAEETEKNLMTQR